MGRPPTPAAMKDFAKRARSILWRESKGDGKHSEYDRFEERVEELRKEYTLNQSVVQAAKDWPCLKKLFRLYDVMAFDPCPGSHPAIPVVRVIETEGPIDCEDKELSYRENLNWAMDAAGAFLRTGIKPDTCPNDRAYYLYIQASESPKDFLQRLGQAELKGDDPFEQKKNMERATKRTVGEIEEMLSSLDEEMKVIE